MEQVIDKKEHILQTAERLFAEKGFDAVSIRELAKEAEVNIAMISYYFGSKEKMYEEYFLYRLSKTRNAIIQIKSKNAAPIDKLKDIIELYVERLTANPDFLKIMTKELYQENRPAIKKIITENIKNNRKEVVAIIEEGIATNDFREVDIELSFMTIMGTILHVTNNTEKYKMLCKSEDELITEMDENIKLRLTNHLKTLLENHIVRK